MPAWKIPKAQRAAFGEALREALALRHISQGQLAERMGTGQSVISTWCRGGMPHAPKAVFALEDVLDLPPGWLSRHLGYGPLAQPRAMTVEQAVLDDPSLTVSQKEELLYLLPRLVHYNATVKKTRARKRRR